MSLLRSALVLSLLCALPATAAQGDPKVREAAQRGITFLARSTAAWQQQHQCYGCHVQAVTLEGLAVGKHHQYAVPAKELGIILEGVLHSKGGARTAGGLSQDTFPLTARTFGGMAFARYDQYVDFKLRDDLLKLHLTGSNGKKKTWLITVDAYDAEEALAGLQALLLGVHSAQSIMAPMSDDRTIDLDALRRDASQKGWFLTRDVLGDPSGGGVAYVCVKTHLLETVRAQVIQSAAVGTTATESLEQAAAMVRHLAKAVAPDSEEFGVLKVSKRLDGRMKREIRALSNCTHPSLVPILASAPGDEPDWYIMKFFSRGDLAHRWGDYQGRVVEVLRRTREIAEALAIIHAKNLIHRDIKPANILLAADGRWVLADFGIVYEDGATRHTLHGAPPMSKDWRPEWVVSRYVEKFDPVVDIHSLARVARAMIAGPDNNPPVSHLEEPDFDLRQICRGVEHINEIQQFFCDHITHKPGQSKSKTAQEFIAKIDELLALHNRRRGQQQVFSMVLTHSLSWIGNSTLGQAQNLRLLLPPGVTRFRGSIRLRASNPESIIRVQVSIRHQNYSTKERRAFAENPERLSDFNEGALALRSNEVLVRVAGTESLGTWWDFELTPSSAMPTEAFLNVDDLSDPSIAITAILLVAEFLA